MASTIILNSTNQVTQNRFQYTFPSTVKFSSEDTIALQSISMYHSIFNIEAQRGNNTFSIIWNADTSVQHDFTIPDGFYDIGTLNYYVQKQCILNDLYCTNADGQYVYFISILTNASVYGAQINCAALPTAANAATLGYTKPAGASWSFPVSDKSPQFIIPTAAFGSLLGMQAATYPPTVLAIDSQHLSTATPQIAPVNSIVLGCNLISSQYSNPNHVFYSIPIAAGFGSLINHANSSPIYNQIASGSYSKIVIDLYDQTFESLRLNDPEVVIVLSIVRKISQV